MLRILIADDHPDQVASLKQTIALGYGDQLRIYEAFDGYEALETIKSQSIDIVVTDIRMPGMDGLELIRNIRILSPRTEIVVLSGYAQFEYAQRSLEYRVTHYLLKPVEGDQLLQCIAELQSNLAKRDDEDRMIYAYKNNRQLLIATCLLDVLQAKILSSTQFADRVRILELPTPANDQIYLMTARMEGGFLQYNQYDVSIMEFAIRNMFEELLGDQWVLLSCKDSYDDLVFAIYRKSVTHDGFAELEVCAKKLQEQVEKLLKGRISLVAARIPTTSPSEMVSSYKEISNCLKRLDYRSEGRWEMVENNYAESAVGSVGLKSLYEPPLLYRLFETRQWAQAQAKLETIFAEMVDKELMTVAHKEEVFYGITSSFAYVTHRNGVELSQLVSSSSRSPKGAHEFRSIEHLQQWIMEMFLLIQERLIGTMEKPGLTLMERVIIFVEKNISRDLSLQSIADHVGLHPVYLSRIFKLETGSGLSSYLLKIRMEKAVTLLAETDLKIYEIASQLGYLTPHYFIKLFKEHYGTTPQEYRETME